ncbi:MAG: leucine-rich repeat domain-containing protein [Clostridia bacterium]|nr:leucine-rich repeat domain-containing protein [Clostridia bacterium]
MANANKVTINTENGEEVLIDITDSTVTKETLAEGVTAYDKSGEKITGTMKQNVSGGGSSGGVPVEVIARIATRITANDLQGVLGIGTYAFYNYTSLQSVEFPDTLLQIQNYSFYGCTRLTSITIPENVSVLGTHSFYGCTGLTNATILSTKADEISANMFYQCNKLASVTFPSNIKSIGSYAFYKCSSLKTIALDSVTSIGTYAFQDCTSLESVTLANGLSGIPNYGFRNCSKLQSVTIPSSVRTIGSYAFNGCSALQIIDFSSHTSVPTLSNSNAFNSVSSSCQFRVPSALLSTWKSATNWSSYASKIVGV